MSRAFAVSTILARIKAQRPAVVVASACCASVLAVLAAWHGRGQRVVLEDVLHVALAVAAPALLAWLLLLRELAPLAALVAPLQALAGDGRPAQPAGAGAGAASPRLLARGLAQAVEHAAAHIRELERARMAGEADARLMEYARDKMQAVLQCLPDGVLVLDPAGDVIFASGKIEPMLGVQMERVFALPPQAWCEDAPLRALLAAVRNGSSDALRRSTIEFTPARVPDKHLCATVQPLTGDGSDLVFGTLVVLRDATREQVARQASNDFVAHVSHELASPLQVIGTAVEQLADPGCDVAPRARAIDTIQDEAERMATLVNNLLNVSRLETGAMRPERQRVKLDGLLRDCVQLAQPRAHGRQVRLHLQLPHALDAVAADLDLLRIALNNLLDNAVKYSNDGGSVTLAAEQGDHELVISVRDGGIGIAPEDQARVMEKFYRVRDAGAAGRGGHGLGLYLAKQIVELHQGRLELDSEPGHGSTFSIHLQRARAEPGEG
ncbi:sensor histidine kinase [Massilia rhizosphaerae]|uniref:sensor histidine kinase n=1 Tax=Massilia rhizosphaerae TaxID=2784389 RepID=UPI0018DBA7B3|nr:ATP-binding protein [Massilia rhizosphaerae]